MLTKASILLSAFIVARWAGALPASEPHQANLPTFPETYLVQGLIVLPYVEIKEPFTAYYDAANKRSRVDYYGDLQLTYQRADIQPHGVSYKVAYMPLHDREAPQRTCFQVNGSESEPVAVQSILPDTSGLTLQGEEPCPNEYFAHEWDSCEVWRQVTQVGSKENRYTLWVSRDGSGNAVPIQYEMMGYDSLLGSHYDKYMVAYGLYSTDPFSDEVFTINETITCHGFPGPGLRYAVHEMNPIKEFVEGHDDHNQKAFVNFKNSFSKIYPAHRENTHREHIFRQNFRYIHSKNRADLGYQLAVNHLADRSDQERMYLRGRLASPGYNGGAPFHKENYNIDALPDSMDWRLYGAVTPVKDQAICGSCWSFGTTGTLEGAYFLKHKVLKKFSPQQLVDCSWTDQNNGCDGGEDFRSYQYIKRNGLSTEEDYGPYLGVDGQCHNATITLRLSSYVNVTSMDNEALKLAIYNHGPISVAIDASHRAFSFYSNGVYYDPDCKNKNDELDHAVLAVGYGVMNGEPYWLVKNSWSTYWGNDGYVLMSQKDNNCGVATSPTYVLLE